MKVDEFSDEDNLAKDLKQDINIHSIIRKHLISTLRYVMVKYMYTKRLP